MNEPFESIICIVNRGFTDLVMTAARQAGARGGTVISARGTGSPDVEKFFGVAVTPEKEIVIILVPRSIRDKVLLAVNEGAGMDTKGQGIAFAIPVSDTVGLQSPDLEDNETSADGQKADEE